MAFMALQGVQHLRTAAVGAAAMRKRGMLVAVKAAGGLEMRVMWNAVLQLLNAVLELQGLTQRIQFYICSNSRSRSSSSSNSKRSGKFRWGSPCLPDLCAAGCSVQPPSGKQRYRTCIQAVQHRQDQPNHNKQPHSTCSQAVQHRQDRPNHNKQPHSTGA
jgi:hypothetical protein